MTDFKTPRDHLERARDILEQQARRDLNYTPRQHSAFQSDADLARQIEALTRRLDDGRRRNR